MHAGTFPSRVIELTSQRFKTMHLDKYGVAGTGKGADVKNLDEMRGRMTSLRHNYSVALLSCSILSYHFVLFVASGIIKGVGK